MHKQSTQNSQASSIQKKQNYPHLQLCHNFAIVKTKLFSVCHAKTQQQ